MKITIVNGSPRKSGATASLLKEMVDYLERKDDVEISYINIADYNLLSCSGCMHCYKEGVCCLNDNVEDINNTISQSDGLIIGSPTYSSGIPGSLKTFIDRGHFVLEQSLKGKYTFALNTYEIAGGNNVINQLQTLFKYSGGIVSGSYLCKVPYNKLPEESSKHIKKLLRKTDRYYKAINNQQRKSILNKLINFIALKIIMKPQVMKRPEQYKAVLDRWKKAETI